MGTMSGRGLEDQSQSCLFWGEQKSGFKDFREGGINPAFILLAPVLSSGLVVSCPLCRGCFSRCRESVIFSPWSSTLNGILFLFCREEARLDKTACGRGRPTATRCAWSTAPGSDATTNCFLYKVRPSAISSVASGITQGQVLILISPPGAKSWLFSTLGCYSPSCPGAHGLRDRPDE